MQNRTAFHVRMKQTRERTSSPAQALHNRARRQANTTNTTVMYHTLHTGATNPCPQRSPRNSPPPDRCSRPRCTLPIARRAGASWPFSLPHRTPHTMQHVEQNRTECGRTTGHWSPARSQAYTSQVHAARMPRPNMPRILRITARTRAPACLRLAFVFLASPGN